MTPLYDLCIRFVLQFICVCNYLHVYFCLHDYVCSCGFIMCLCTQCKVVAGKDKACSIYSNTTPSEE